MRMNHWWMPLTLASFSALACGPEISVGDLGSKGGAAGMTSTLGGGGSVLSDGGAPMKASAGAPMTSSGGAPMSAAGAPGMGAHAGMSSGGTSAAGAPAIESGGSMSVAGSAGVGGSALPPGCPPDLKQALPAKAADCPDAPAEGSCDWTENAICVWQDGPMQAGFTAEGCYASLMGKVAYGPNQGNLGDIGVNSDQCPKMAPDPNSSCAMHAGQHCYYPYEDCACGASEGNWKCQANPKPDSPPIEVQRLCPPTGIDETKPLKDLSDMELLTWCNWYGDPSGAPRPQISPNDPPGVAQSYASVFSVVGVSVCLSDLPAALCVQNIRTQPNCTATLGELDDCVETLHAVEGATSGFVGHGCAPLMENPTCANVIAQPWDGQDTHHQCKVPLE